MSNESLKDKFIPASLLKDYGKSDIELFYRIITARDNLIKFMYSVLEIK